MNTERRADYFFPQSKWKKKNRQLADVLVVETQKQSIYFPSGSADKISQLRVSKEFMVLCQILIRSTPFSRTGYFLLVYSTFRNICPKCYMGVQGLVGELWSCLLFHKDIAHFQSKTALPEITNGVYDSRAKWILLS